MASERKFYKTVLTVEVLSEEPINDMDLQAIAYQINEGDYSGQIEVGEPQEVDGLTMAKLLEAQGSDPGFFQLDPEGNELDDV